MSVKLLFSGLRQVPLPVTGEISDIQSSSIVSQQEQQHYASYDKAETKSKSVSASDDRIADYTFWLVLFTAVLAISTVGLWSITRKSVNVAERAVVELERPFLHADVFGRQYLARCDERYNYRRNEKIEDIPPQRMSFNPNDPLGMLTPES